MINFQIIKKKEKMLGKYFGVSSFCAKYFLKIRYFKNYVLKFKCGGVI